jgi:transcriptional regulator with XRE-family HTH domain
VAGERPAIYYGMRTRLQVTADRAADERLRVLVGELRRLREDAGVGQATVARHAGIARSHLSMIEAGNREPSWAVLTRVAAVLGADLGMRLFPTGEVRLRDRFQAPMIEALLCLLPDRWSRAVEVAVHRPARGFIDCVISDRNSPNIVSIEAHSEIRRLEAQIRSAIDKSASLPSSDLWPFLTLGSGRSPIHRVLLLRSTVANREIARSFATTLAAAYPARTADVHAALLDPDRPWPGNGIVWARVDRGTATILPGVPRGVALGR